MNVLNFQYIITELSFKHLFISLNPMKDKRHNTVKILIETNNITTFADIFEHIPKTTVAEELGIHFNRMTKLISKVNEIKVNDIYLFSGYFEVDAAVIFRLISNQRAKKSSTNGPEKPIRPS
jgi:hypothetical protein